MGKEIYKAITDTHKVMQNGFVSHLCIHYIIVCYYCRIIIVAVDIFLCGQSMYLVLLVSPLSPIQVAFEQELWHELIDLAKCYDIHSVANVIKHIK